MLRNILRAALLAAISVLPASAQKKNYKVCAIAFYNFENFFDPYDDPRNKGDDEFTPTGSYHYTEEIYRQKCHNLATVLQRLGTELTPDGPALIGTAEIENDRVLQDLTAQPEIKDRGYQFVHFESPDFRGIDVALLYNPKYFRVLSAEALPVYLNPGERKSTTRDVLHVYGILSGDTVHVFVNHWPSRLGGEVASAPRRAIAASVDKHMIDSLMGINPATRVIVMGDLNDDPVSPSVAKVLGAKGDKDKVGLGELYNPWVSFYQKGIGTLGYDDKWNLFDQVMISGAFLRKDDSRWNYYKAEVFNKDFLIQKFGQYKGYPHRSFAGNNWDNGFSDHFPAVIYMIKAQ